MGEKLRQVIPITNIDMVKQLCSSLDAFLPPAGTEGLERTDMDQVRGLTCITCRWESTSEGCPSSGW